MNTWKLTRHDTAEALTLPQDMQWTDEFDWTAVAQTAPVYALSGSLLVQQGVKLAGRPITLAGSWVWHPRATLAKLRDWADSPNLKMTLTHYDGRTFTVIFRSHDKALGNVAPIRYATPEDGSARYEFTLQLMTV